MMEVVANMPGISLSASRSRVAEMASMHTCFDDIGLDVLENSIDLFPHKLGGYVVDVFHAQRVLRCQCRRRRHGITAMGSDDFLVSFDTPGRTRLASHRRPVIGRRRGRTSEPGRWRGGLTLRRSYPSQRPPRSWRGAGDRETSCWFTVRGIVGQIGQRVSVTGLQSRRRGRTGIGFSTKKKAIGWAPNGRLRLSGQQLASHRHWEQGDKHTRKRNR